MTWEKILKNENDFNALLLQTLNAMDDVKDFKMQMDSMQVTTEEQADQAFGQLLIRYKNLKNPLDKMIEKLERM